MGHVQQTQLIRPLSAKSQQGTNPDGSSRGTSPNTNITNQSQPQTNNASPFVQTQQSSSTVTPRTNPSVNNQTINAMPPSISLSDVQMFGRIGSGQQNIAQKQTTNINKPPPPHTHTANTTKINLMPFNNINQPQPIQFSQRLFNQHNAMRQQQQQHQLALQQQQQQQMTANIWQQQKQQNTEYRNVNKQWQQTPKQNQSLQYAQDYAWNQPQTQQTQTPQQTNAYNPQQPQQTHYNQPPNTWQQTQTQPQNHQNWNQYGYQ